jgi:hypothetical protein
MPNPSNVRGMLLEEALLYLLRHSGYQTVETAGSDETLHLGSAGLEVKGRGGVHQIDAISDFFVTPPFSYPQRLLIEAKCYEKLHQKVGVEIIRNAVGVLKDVEEYWVSRDQNLPARKRYHYQYAIFSSTGFAKPAQRYAFAQDIYLIPLARSFYFLPVLDAINHFGAIPAQTSLREMRSTIRETLKQSDINRMALVGIDEANQDRFQRFIQACRQLDSSIIAMFGKRFPVFLTPSPSIDPMQLEDNVRIQIRRDHNGWYIRYAEAAERLFSFDLPDEMFDLYAEGNILNANQAIRMKQDWLRTIQAIVTTEDRYRIITFSLDQEWINGILRRRQN